MTELWFLAKLPLNCWSVKCNVVLQGSRGGQSVLDVGETVPGRSSARSLRCIERPRPMPRASFTSTTCELS